MHERRNVCSEWSISILAASVWGTHFTRFCTTIASLCHLWLPFFAICSLHYITVWWRQWSMGPSEPTAATPITTTWIENNNNNNNERSNLGTMALERWCLWIHGLQRIGALGQVCSVMCDKKGVPSDAIFPMLSFVDVRWIVRWFLSSKGSSVRIEQDDLFFSILCAHFFHPISSFLHCSLHSLSFVLIDPSVVHP